MQTLHIFSDSPLSDAAAALLREGTDPHEVLFAAAPSASVLAKAEPDARFDTVEIAFGQPDVDAIRRSSRLRWVHLTSAGFTRYDTPEFRTLAAESGLTVTNSSSVYAAPCAEHVFAFMLAHSRRLAEGLGMRTPSGSPEWFQLRNTSASLRGQRALILGFGAIAEQLLKLLGPFEMKLSAYRRKARGDEGLDIVTTDNLNESLAAADHVINILPDNADSRNFIDRHRLAAMKPGAVFYNIGRGTTVDQEALHESLRSGHLGAAWLDVTDPEPLPEGHPLLSAPRCWITPHTAGGQYQEAEALVNHFLHNFHLFLSGAPLRDRIM